MRRAFDEETPMKAFLFGIAIVALPTVALAQYGTGSNLNSHYVQPHMTSSGESVSGHYQTNPNSTTLDNYGTRGNVNPYTGAIGHRSGY
jgi:hypothetical protein